MGTTIIRDCRGEYYEDSDVASALADVNTLGGLKTLVDAWVEQYGQDAVVDITCLGYECPCGATISKLSTKEKYDAQKLNREREQEARERARYEELAKKFNT